MIKEIQWRYLIGLILFVTVMGTCGNAHATDWYVDVTGGDDSNAGTSTGAPLQTISAAEDSGTTAGDDIALKAGGEWREQLTVPASGSDGSPITYTRYGTGDDPVINGADLMSNWVAVDDSTWYKLNVVTEPKIVMFDDSLGTKGGNSSSLSNKKWYWHADGSDTLTICAIAPADTSNIEAGQRSYGILLDNDDYIVLNNIEVKCANIDNILLSDTSDNNTISYCASNYSGSVGISTLTDNSTITYTTISYSGWTGLKINNGDNNIVSFCSINNNVGYGIQVITTANSNIIESCTINDNGSHGIYLLTSCDNNVMRYNNIYGNANGVYISTNCDDDSVYYNLIRNNNNEGILVNSNCDGINILNNVLWDNLDNFQINLTTNDNLVFKNNISLSPTTDKQHIRFNNVGTSYTGSNNCFWPEKAKGFYTGASNIATLSAWQDSSGTETNSINTQPAFADTTTYDFRLTKESGAIIEGGTPVGLDQDYAGDSIILTPDIGAYEYNLAYDVSDAVFEIGSAISDVMNQRIKQTTDRLINVRIHR